MAVCTIQYTQGWALSRTARGFWGCVRKIVVGGVVLVIGFLKILGRHTGGRRKGQSQPQHQGPSEQEINMRPLWTLP